MSPTEYIDGVRELLEQVFPPRTQKIDVDMDLLAKVLSAEGEVRQEIATYKEDHDILGALYAAGVDSWDGYEAACEMLEQP